MSTRVINSSLSGRPFDSASATAAPIQPHGMLLVLQQPHWRIVQVSANLSDVLQRSLAWLLDASLCDLGGDIEAQVRGLASTAVVDRAQPLACWIAVQRRPLALEGLLHRGDDGLWLAELQPAQPDEHGSHARRLGLLRGAVQRLSEASTLPALADALALSMRELTGHASAAVWQRGRDGRDVCLSASADQLTGQQPDDGAPAFAAAAPALGRHVHAVADLAAVPVGLQPALPVGASRPADLPPCLLRGATALQARHLQAAGARASLDVPLWRQGQLWGWVRCLHGQPLQLSLAALDAAQLVAEVAATRIAAIEQYGQAQAAAQAMAQVRQLQQRLLAATAAEGDWRQALMREPSKLLQPLAATGAALSHQGDTLACGDTPAAAALRRLVQWIDRQPLDRGAFAGTLAAAGPPLDAALPDGGQVLAVRLSASRPDYLLWFRSPALPDPGQHQAWTSADLATARSFGDCLADVIVQVNAVRLLIAEQQLAQLRATVADAREPVVVVDAARRAVHANDAFLALATCSREQCASLDALLARFATPALALQVMDQVQASARPWHGEMALVALAADGQPTTLPVALRAEPVPARDGSMLGLILTFSDLSASKRAEAARQRLEASLAQAGSRISCRLGEAGAGHRSAAGDGLMAAILANASLAAMDIAEGGSAADVAPLLQELQAATERATALCQRIRDFDGGGASAEGRSSNSLGSGRAGPTALPP